jgi:ADP-ribose pyrophosphatase YjhB (NUDIX family)
VQAEIARLRRRYGRPRSLVHTLPSFGFGPLNRGREAEVAMAIRRRNGLFLLQTKENYPASTFRLPTGGIKRGEAIEHALLRETDEETGLSVEVSRFVAEIRYRTPDQGQAFATYLFILEEQGGVLQTTDPTERISGWLEADAARLNAAAHRLRSCTGSWRAWGHFRALVLDALVAAVSSVASRGALRG